MKPNLIVVAVVVAVVLIVATLLPYETRAQVVAAAPAADSAECHVLKGEAEEAGALGTACKQRFADGTECVMFTSSGTQGGAMQCKFGDASGAR
jgi:hypothetical protein